MYIYRYVVYINDDDFAFKNNLFYVSWQDVEGDNRFLDFINLIASIYFYLSVCKVVIRDNCNIVNIIY